MLSLVNLFDEKKAELSTAFQKLIGWKDFNFRSPDQVKDYLYGTQPGKPRLRPEDVETLNRTPVTTTEKPPRDWLTVPQEDREAGKINPSTNGENLQILAETAGSEHERNIIEKLRQLRFVDQVAKNFLRPPVETEGDGDLEWDSGLVFEIDPDNRTRTHIGQLTDTGRYTSSKPNLQNLSKKQEYELRKVFCDDVERLYKVIGWGGMSEDELKKLGLLHPDYYSLRSCYTATPGNVLIEADYRQAELFVLAYMSEDPGMIAIMNDPTTDLHSEMAVIAFNLACSPDEVKKMFPAQRVMAKNVNFGISYGRGAKALARQAQAEGVKDATPEKMQQIIDTFYERFPMVKDYIKRCHAAVKSPGYVETAYGRRRYFYPTTDRKIRSAQEREAQNMPIQGTVGGALDVAIRILAELRTESNMRFKLVLPIHDAIFLDTPIDEVGEVVNCILPTAMTECCTIPVLNIKLAIDTEIMWRWNEKVSMEEAVELSLDAQRKLVGR